MKKQSKLLAFTLATTLFLPAIQAMSDVDGRLLDAAFGGHTERVELLLRHGANTEAQDSDGYTPLHGASYLNNNTVMVRLLLRFGANIEAQTFKGLTPLHIAARNGCTKMIELLLQDGANIEAQTRGGYTPLHLATTTKPQRQIDREVVKALLQSGTTMSGGPHEAFPRTAAGQPGLFHW